MSNNRNFNPLAGNIVNSNQSTNPLKIVYWNAAGIANKTTELESFMIRLKVDIMMVVETRTDLTSSTNIDGYTNYFVTNPESSRKGGVAIYIKQSIRHSALESIAIPCVQCAPILIFPTHNNRNPVIIAPIYCPPIFNWTNQHFNRLFNKIDSLFQGGKLLICGDWNAKHTWWGNVRSCMRGRALLEVIQNNNRFNILATGGATHFPYTRRNRPSAIDFAVYAGVPNEALYTYSTIDLDSDHLPIHIEFRLNNFIPPCHKAQLITKYTNVQTFQRHLEANIHTNTELNCGADIEYAISILNRNIYEAAAAATQPVRPIRIRTNHSGNRFQLSDNSLRLLNLKKQYKRELLIQHSATSRQLYRKTQNQLKKSLKKDKANIVNSLLEHVDTSDRYRMQKLWQVTNKIKRQPEPNWPLKIQRDANCPPSWTKTCLEKAETFAEHLEQRFRPIYSNSDNDRATVMRELDFEIRNKQQLQQTGLAPYLRPVPAAEILQLIDTLPLKKSSGWDNINNKVLKLLPNNAITYLSLIFTAILRHSHFPHDWKLATISMILKPGKCANEVSSYRPISLLCSFSKLFEKILMERLFEVENFCTAIPSHQFGFRKEHGTDQQLFRVTQFILKAFESRKYCSAVYIDISEAFDRVWHAGLLNKLVKLLPIELFLVLQSYLHNRSFLVKGVNDVKSRTCQIRAGVPQGSVLGPLLYTIYTSDMPLPSPNSSCTLLLSTFADDTVIMATSEVLQYAIRANQRYLNRLETWAKLWCIKINASKTAHIIYSTRRLDPTQRTLTLQLNSDNIVNNSRHKYLGLHLDSKLNLKFHIAQLRARLIGITEKLKWLLGRQCKLTRKCKALVYKQLVAPVWHYAIPIWGALASTSQVRRIDVLQNKILRKATNTPWYTRNLTMLECYNIVTAEEIFMSSSSRLTNTLANHPNIEARLLIINPYVPQRLQRSRYATQLETCIIPLQSQIPLPQPLPQLPTLIRLAEDEATNRASVQIMTPRPYPPLRMSEGLINSYRRDLRHGNTTRERLVERLQGQHINIQRLVLPDFLVMEQRGPPELWQYNQTLNTQQTNQVLVLRPQSSNLQQSQNSPISHPFTTSSIASHTQETQTVTQQNEQHSQDNHRQSQQPQLRPSRQTIDPEQRLTRLRELVQELLQLTQPH